MWVCVKKSYSVDFNLRIVVRIVIVMFVEKTHEFSLCWGFWHTDYADSVRMPFERGLNRVRTIKAKLQRCFNDVAIQLQGCFN